MSEFKVNEWITFFVNDWLGSTPVRLLKPDVKGFYIDLMCQLHKGFPYGYCSMVNDLKTKELQNLVNHSLNQGVNHMVKGEDNHMVEFLVQLMLHLSVSEQLKVSINIEDHLESLLPYSKADITRYINVLENKNIISRGVTGVIYQKRMVHDFRRRVVAYLNGSKGGHSRVKVPEKNIKLYRKYIKELEISKLEDLVEVLDNQGVNPLDKQTVTNPIINRNEGIREGEGESMRGETKFSLQKIYDQSFEELHDKKYSKDLTEEGFRLWKEFVDMIVEKNLTDIFIAKFIQPADFQAIYENGFTKSFWEPVVRKILSSGIEEKHNLFFRLPEFMKFVKEPGGKTDKKTAIHAKGDDYGGMPGFKK